MADVSTCQKCGGRIKEGVLHNCLTGSLEAPWLAEMMKEQKALTYAVHAELARIRELLESPAYGVKPAKPVDARETRPSPKVQRRETRTGGYQPDVDPDLPAHPPKGGSGVPSR